MIVVKINGKTIKEGNCKIGKINRLILMLENEREKAYIDENLC
jgi:hypothetical protein